MPTDTIRTRQARVEFRTTSGIKELIERAAILQGRTVTEYVISVLLEKSQEIVQANETRILSAPDREIFLKLLESPPQPNEALLKAARRFKDEVESGELVV